MRLPNLSDIPVTRDLVDAFGGYNHNLRIGNGEFYDMTNLTSSHYPVISPRPKRGIYIKNAAPTGLIAKDSLCYTDGRDFVINGHRVDMNLNDEPKNLISMGAYVIVMPDKKWIKTISNKDDSTAFDHGDIEKSWDNTEFFDTVSFQISKLDGSDYENIQPGVTAPTITEEMKEGSATIPIWLDTSSIPHCLRQYSTTNEEWVAIATTYIKISAPNIGMPFEEGDGVTISGIKDERLADLNNTMVIWAKGDGYIIVTGIIDETIAQAYYDSDGNPQPIYVKRQMPEMDFIIESGNRLWGCHYGIALNGEVVNEIYASKLGDFKNWNTFAGISTDSYAATVGTDGKFTGAITHLGYPLFFKENYVHKVYGNIPANYQIQTTACRGVQDGCRKSLAIVNEVLYYKSRSAVCAYDGSLPVEVSSALGEEWYSNAVAGTLGNKYYISMSDNSGKYHLFVYDTKMGTWHKEDNTQVKDFCNCRGDLYFIDGKDYYIKNILCSTYVEQEGAVEWMAETGIIGVDMPDKKYISRMDVRMLISVGTRVSFFVQYDSSEVWELMYTMTGASLQTFSFPIKPRRCDHLRLRIVGDGEAKIFSICKSIEQGSDK